MVCIILLGFVNKTGNSTGDVITGEAANPLKTSFISDLFTQWSAGDLDVNIAKYLFFFMLAGLIWGALSFAKFPPNAFFQAVIALPVAFLAMAYITPQEVFTILQSYTALGITLTFIVPFMIMIFVSAMLLSNEVIKSMSLPKIMLEWFLWAFFDIVLIYKMIEGFVLGRVSFGLNLTALIMVGASTLSVLIFVFNKTFRKWVWKLGFEIRKVKGESERLEAEQAARILKGVEKERGKWFSGSGGI